MAQLEIDGDWSFLVGIFGKESVVELVSCAGAAIMRVVGETTVDRLNLVLAGWSHDAGSQIIGDRDWDTDVAVPDVEG